MLRLDLLQRAACRLRDVAQDEESDEAVGYGVAEEEPVVANGVLYVATQSHLYALHDEARAKAATDQKKTK